MIRRHQLFDQLTLVEVYQQLTSSDLPLAIYF